MNAIEMIQAERKRQVETEGWSVGHDDDHRSGELARAAAAYAMNNREREMLSRHRESDHSATAFERLWPWSFTWWKPTPGDRVRELVKAGALIVAEIERLQRKGVEDGPA